MARASSRCFLDESTVGLVHNSPRLIFSMATDGASMHPRMANASSYILTASAFPPRAWA